MFLLFKELNCNNQIRCMCLDEALQVILSAYPHGLKLASVSYESVTGQDFACYTTKTIMVLRSMYANNSVTYVYKNNDTLRITGYPDGNYPVLEAVNLLRGGHNAE